MGATARAADTPVNTTARGSKSQAAFRTISEVADELDVAQHVLRFWESKFPQVRPLKRGGGRRYYRPEDIELLRDIRSLLYDEGYTIKGAQKLLRQRRAKPPAPVKPADAAPLQAELRAAHPEPPTRAPPSTTPASAAPGDRAGAAAEPSAAQSPAERPAPAVEPAPAAQSAPESEVERLARLRAELRELRAAVDEALTSAED